MPDPIHLAGHLFRRHHGNTSYHSGLTLSVTRLPAFSAFYLFGQAQPAFLGRVFFLPGLCDRFGQSGEFRRVARIEIGIMQRGRLRLPRRGDRVCDNEE